MSSLSNYCYTQPTNTLYYPFTEISSSFISDESGHGNHGFAINVVPADDRFGNADCALYFNGANSHIIFDGSVFQYEDYSYSLWVNMLEYPGFAEAGFILDIGSAYGVDQYIASVNAYSNYNIYGWLGQGYNTDGSSTWLFSNELPALNAWYFIVYCRSSSGAKLFVNAQCVAEQVLDDLYPIYGIDTKGRVGCRNNDQQFFRGFIDDVRIFNYVLSQTEIDSLFNITSGLIPKKSFIKPVFYPNPASQEITLKYHPGLSDNIHLEIYSLEGLVLFKGTKPERIDLSKLPNGLYILKWHDSANNAKGAAKVVIRH